MITKGCARGCGIAAAAFALLFVSTIALTVRGCINSHDRPGGQDDVTFGISSQGDKVVFNAAGDGGRDLYVLDLTSLAVERLAATPDYEVAPSFSPDGQSIVYAAGKPGDRADHLFVRRLDRNEVKQLTAEDANDSSPEFSPNGSQIIFTRDKNYNWGGLAAHGWSDEAVVCAINVDGSVFRQITDHQQPVYDPHYSRDGLNILYWSDDGLYTVATDGSKSPKPLITRRVREAVYSPDGQSIALVMGHYAPECEIYVCRSDGTGFRQVTHKGERQIPPENAGIFRPTFTPDGKRIVFFLQSWTERAPGETRRSLWEVAADGNGARKIAGFRLFDDPLHWKPDPKKGVNRPIAR